VKKSFCRIEPCPDVLGSSGKGPPLGGDVLVRVETDLDDVVHEGEERGQREGGDKEGDEAVLDH